MDKNFYTDLDYGKRGEKMVELALTAKGNKLIDVSGDLEYRRNDIDFVVERKRDTITLEVKSDFRSQDTGNFFVEYQNNNNIGHNFEGWYSYSQAQYICFVQQERHKAYIVLFDELARDIEKNNYRRARSNNSWGFLVPIENIVEYQSCYQFAV